MRVERNGPHAAHRLRKEDLASAADIAAHFPAAVDQAIPRWSPDGDFVRSLIDTIVENGHSIWLVGGAVRDLIADAGQPVNDLDFCGTMLLGELYETADELLTLAGLGDHVRRISPGRVFSVAADVDAARLLEYKSLSLTGFRFPASGGDLIDDVVTRDLTVNGVYYDPHHQLIIDPSRRGVEHIRAVPRKIVPIYLDDDAVERAQVILRGLKFKIRWPDADMTEMATWVGSLPANLAERIPEDRWPRLHRMWRRCVPEEHRDEAVKVAERLGSAADRLVHLLRDGCDDGA
ncbi:hypothetical protein GCM10009556_066270 [Acrocarpospora pleiomorpha]